MPEPRAFYNEIDPAAAAWLRWLIDHGHIAPGIVNTQSIAEIEPHDLDGFTQVHFFAGIGGWSLAARLAGWPDARPLWTGSCPCQPFSVAGKGAGIADERHLWPHFYRLIGARRPATVMGEQVAGAAGYDWLDGVRADLAGEGYACRGVDIPSCAVDAPHIRSRLYWVATDGNMAHANQPVGRFGHQQSAGQQPQHEQDAGASVWAGSGHGSLVNAARIGRGEGRPEPELRSARATSAGADASIAVANRNDDERHGQEGYASKPGSDGQDGRLHHGVHSGTAGSGTVANPESQRGGRDKPQRGSQGRAADGRADAGHCGVGLADTDSERRQEQRSTITVRAQQFRLERLAGRNGSFWSDHEWITCHDGKARRAQPGIPMLVDGLPGRVAAWRGFGNAINPILAAEVIAAFLDTESLYA